MYLPQLTVFLTTLNRSFFYHNGMFYNDSPKREKYRGNYRGKNTIIYYGDLPCGHLIFKSLVLAHHYVVGDSNTPNIYNNLYLLK